MVNFLITESISFFTKYRSRPSASSTTNLAEKSSVFIEYFITIFPVGIDAIWSSSVLHHWIFIYNLHWRKRQMKRVVVSNFLRLIFFSHITPRPRTRIISGACSMVVEASIDVQTIDVNKNSTKNFDYQSIGWEIFLLFRFSIFFDWNGILKWNIPVVNSLNHPLDICYPFVVQFMA